MAKQDEGMKRGRRTFQQQLEANEAAMRFYAAATPAEKELMGLGVPYESLTHQVITPAPQDTNQNPRYRKRLQRPKRAVAATGEPLEREIRKSILAYLKTRPDVIFAGSFNSGTAVETTAGGNERYIKMNTLRGFPDIHGLLLGGRALYVEVKRGSTRNRLTPDQTEFLFRAKSAGACAGVATCIEDVQKLLSDVPFFRSNQP